MHDLAPHGISNGFNRKGKEGNAESQAVPQHELKNWLPWLVRPRYKSDMRSALAWLGALAGGLGLLLAGCTTTPSAEQAERGPDGTIAYRVEIEASELGVRIEANDDYVGKTPMTLTIYGDKDGTFHNFDSQEYIIRAFPLSTNQAVQTKVFRTGGWFSQEDQIPKRIYFDMNQPGGLSIDLKPRY